MDNCVQIQSKWNHWYSMHTTKTVILRLKKKQSKFQKAGLKNTTISFPYPSHCYIIKILNLQNTGVTNFSNLSVFKSFIAFQ